MIFFSFLRLFWKKNLTSEAIIQCVWFFFPFWNWCHASLILRIDIDIGIKIESTFFFGKMSSRHSYKRPWRHRKIQIVAVMLKRSPVIYWGKCSIIDSKNDKKVIHFRCGPTKKTLLNQAFPNLKVFWELLQSHVGHFFSIVNILNTWIISRVLL